MQKQTIYTTFQTAFDHFNRRLFGNDLPPCIITLTRAHKKAFGFFWANKFERRDRSDYVDEIGMNPDLFVDRPDREILSTLVHEMAHLWQQHHGKTSRNGYHNREWANKMISLGLHPSDTGKEGGKETGQRMSHFIVARGAYDQAFGELLRDKFKLEWQSFVDVAEAAEKPKTESKVKFTCPQCEQNGWGKPDSYFLCGECSEPKRLVEMLSA